MVAVAILARGRHPDVLHALSPDNCWLRFLRCFVCSHGPGRCVPWRVRLPWPGFPPVLQVLCVRGWAPGEVRMWRACPRPLRGARRCRWLVGSAACTCLPRRHRCAWRWPSCGCSDLRGGTSGGGVASQRPGGQGPGLAEGRLLHIPLAPRRRSREPGLPSWVSKSPRRRWRSCRSARRLATQEGLTCPSLPIQLVGLGQRCLQR